MIVDGLAIVVGAEAVYAVDLSSGELAWDVERAGGPISMPAVASGRPRTLLYLEGSNADDSAATPSPTSSPTGDGTASPGAGTATDAGSSLVAVDLADQTELWRTPLDSVSRTGVTVDGDTAYVGTEDGTVYAVAVADGAVRWTGDTSGRIDVSLSVADGRVLVISRAADSRGVAVAAYDTDDGSRSWRVESPVGATASSSATLGEGLVVVALADRLVHALDAEDGQERWASLSLQLFAPATSPALQEGALFVADLGGGLYRLDATDGARTWSYQFNEVALRSSPVISGGSVLLGLNDGRMVAVDPASGHLVWQSASSPGLVGAIAVSSDAVVAVKGGEDGGMIAFENDPDGRLVDVASPTELEAGTTFGRMGIAAAIALAALLLPGMLLRRRFGHGGFVDAVTVDDAEESP